MDRADGRGDLDSDVASRPVHVGAVVIPAVATIVTAMPAVITVIDVADTSCSAEHEGAEREGEKKFFGPLIHGWALGFSLSMYSTRLMAAPEGSATTAKRLPCAAGRGATRIFPPSFTALAAVASMSATRTEPIQPGLESLLTGSAATPARAWSFLLNRRCGLRSTRRSGFTS